MADWENRCSFGLRNVFMVLVPAQLTRNVFGTFAFGCMKVWVNLTFLECYTNVQLWLYERLAEPNV